MNGNPWSPEEMAILREQYPLIGMTGCARFIARSPSSIRRQANKFGIVKISRNKRSYEGVAAPAGHERPDNMGYILVKIANRKWIYKHRLEWEKHYGEPPPGPIEFIDGNRANCEISNLRVTSKRDQLFKNTVHNLPPELREVIHMKGQLTKLIRRQQSE